MGDHDKSDMKDRAKEALERDLEQTKSDMGVDSARDLDQDADDTVRQAMGKQSIPDRGDSTD